MSQIMRLIMPRRRLVECHACGWRAWAPWSHRRHRQLAKVPVDSLAEKIDALDLGAIDAALPPRSPGQKRSRPGRPPSE